MPDKFNAVSVIGLSIAGIIFIILTWKLVADKGWVKGVAFSLAATLLLLVGCFVVILLLVGTAEAFGGVGVLIFLVILTWWSYSRPTNRPAA